jgi:hypothetical protein
LQVVVEGELLTVAEGVREQVVTAQPTEHLVLIHLPNLK